MRTWKELLVRLPLYQSFRAIGYPRMLAFNYTFLISTLCNSRCKTCNIWKQRHNDLTIEEWEKVFTSLGTSPFWVTVSGGEPSLQRHLADMVIAIDRICKPAIINIPTNSLVPERLQVHVARILKETRVPQLIVNLSLDGVGEVHDRVRGAPGNFPRVLENYKYLKNLQKQYKNLAVGFGTVVSTHNIDHIKELFDFIYDLNPDQYVTEIAEQRVELDTVGLPITPNLAQYSEAIDYLLAKMEKRRYHGIGRVSRAFRFQYYQFVKDWLAKKPLLPDFAGFASCEITSWGDVWPSCIKGEKMGNVRQTGYDFGKVWFSPDAQTIRKGIKRQGTSYPLANAFYSSALHHIPTLGKVAWSLI